MKAYTIHPARYAKRSVAIRSCSKGEMKDRVGRLCEALRARWSSRESAYIMSESKGVRFETLFEAGRDASMVFDDALRCSYVLDPEVVS